MPNCQSRNKEPVATITTSAAVRRGAPVAGRVFASGEGGCGLVTTLGGATGTGPRCQICVEQALKSGRRVTRRQRPDFRICSGASDDCRVMSTTPTRRLCSLILILGALFIVLAMFIALHPRPTAFDKTFDRALVAVPGSAAFELLRVLSFTGSATVVTVAGLGLAITCWIRARDKRLVAICLVAVGLAGVAEVVMKQIVRRTRPPTRVLTHESGFGFPSGHTTGATALAVVAIVAICALVPRGRGRTIGIACSVAYAALIAISRVVVGAHYATDVVGGVLLGVVLAIAVTTAVPRLFPHARSESDGSKRLPDQV